MTSIEFQNLFAPTLCFVKFHTIDGQNRGDKITRDRRSKQAWSACILCFPFILSESLTEAGYILAMHLS